MNKLNHLNDLITLGKGKAVEAPGALGGLPAPADAAAPVVASVAPVLLPLALKAHAERLAEQEETQGD